MQKMQELKRVIVHRYIAASVKLLTSISLSSCNNIKTFDLSTLYTTICYAWSSFLLVLTVFLFSSTSTLKSYEADLIQGLLINHEQKLGRSFHFTFHYIGDVLSLIKLVDFVDHICPIKVKIKDTQIQLDSLHTLTNTLKNTVSAE